MLDWLENMSDWNISRKRFYGLPLPFYPCECGELTVVGSKDELYELAVDKSKVDANSIWNPADVDYVLSYYPMLRTVCSNHPSWLIEKIKTL
jgi:isoleucyl-tRNA synthetase